MGPRDGDGAGNGVVGFPDALVRNALGRLKTRDPLAEREEAEAWKKTREALERGAAARRLGLPTPPGRPTPAPVQRPEGRGRA